MALTYTAIATVTVTGSTAASIEFTSIPATYTDLLIKLSLRSDYTSFSGATQQLYMTFNNSGTSYSARQLYGDGSSATSAALSDSGTVISIINTNSDSSTASTFSSTEIYIPNYAGSNNKSASAESVTENNGTAALAGLTAGLWSNTSAITSIKFVPQTATGASWKQYSTATLYGIKNTV